MEDVENNKDWKSVIVTGEAERLRDETKRAVALQAIAAVNPELTPAVSVRRIDNWVRVNVEVIYSILPKVMTGRTSVKRLGNL